MASDENAIKRSILEYLKYRGTTDCRGKTISDRQADGQAARKNDKGIRESESMITAAIFAYLFLGVITIGGIGIVVGFICDKIVWKPIHLIGTPEWYRDQRENQGKLDYEKALQELDDEFPGTDR